VDYNGQRFGKYPLGWPVVLSFGELLGKRSLVNPLLAGLGIWLTYQLGKRTFGRTVGLLAAGLTLTSPFFLINSATLLAHPLGLVLSAAFALFWLDAFYLPKARYPLRVENRWLPTLAAGAALGVLALTRPLTAVAIGLPFALHGVYLLIRGDRQVRLRLIALGVVVLALGALHFAWQFALTGDPLLNPYTLWWEYDKVGFGPGFGHRPEGHTLDQARINTRFSLYVGRHDLFGWGAFSWIFLPFGLWAMRRNRSSWLLASVFPSMVVIYLAYWIGSSLLGPRYFYESLYSLTLVSAAGIAQLAGWPTTPGSPFPNFKGWRRIRPLAITALVALLVCANLIFYTPLRLGNLYGLYGLQRSDLDPFLNPSAQELTPALVIVHPAGKWSEYGSFLELQDPFFSTPFVFVIARSQEANEAVENYFPERNAYHYYTDRPYTFYKVLPPTP
jgi:4-amino-4-deoxy-L-arabinose transferase-like glycosyltransferase